MNARKHVAGFAVFSLILGSAILINHFLNIPSPVIKPVQVRPLVAGTVGSTEAEAITYKVEEVTLDFVNKTSYTVLNLKLRPGQTAPAKLWITTYYFSPDYAGIGWSTQQEFPHPFAAGNQDTFVASDSFNLDVSSEVPRSSYFARVYVTTGRIGYSYSPGVRFDRDITLAEPVVVEWPDERQSTVNTKKFSR